MKTWFIMMGIDLIIPLLMIVLGFVFLRWTPEYGSLLGYRTARARKNNRTWAHAQYCVGVFMETWGRIMTVVAVLPMLVLLYRWGKFIVPVSVALLVVEAVAFIAVIPVTEITLNNIFDKDGELRLNEEVI